MKNKIKNNPELLRYLKGEMTGAERNSFEKELEKDPFLAEALEGYELSGHLEIENDLQVVAGRIRRRTVRKRNFTLYRVAASVAVLMIISSIFIVIERNRPEKQDALPEYKPVTIDIARSEPVREPEEKELPKQVPLPPVRKSVSKPQAAIREDQQTAYDMVREKREVQPENAGRAELTEEPVRERKMPDSNRFIASGYSTKQPAAAARSARRDTQETDAPPQPLGGQKAFDRYITENQTRPDSATTGQRVVVVASFRVKTDGSTDSIKIIRSPQKQFSDEAIRLIREGPAWKPAIRHGVAVEEEVEVRIIFP